jgi:hypothetical protein
VLLESLLDRLTLRYQCRVPRKAEQHYTLGELLGALDTKLKKALQVERPDTSGALQPPVSLQPILDDLAKMGWIRNQVGAHFNTAGMMVPDADVLQFATRTLDLADTLACPVCGAIPDKKKGGSYWVCGGGCGKTRLHPLEQPA